MCEALTADWNKIAAVITALATVVMAILAWLAWKLQNRIEWWAGAMESHSTMMLRLEAEKAGKELRWYDPTWECKWRSDSPNRPEHGDRAEVGVVHIYLPRELRRNPKL